MNQVLEDARRLAHGTYDDVIVVEHRKQAGASSMGGSRDALQGEALALHVVLEMPEGSRVIHTAQQYEIDGVIGDTPPVVGASYRVIVGPPATEGGFGDTAYGSALRYETMRR